VLLKKSRQKKPNQDKRGKKQEKTNENSRVAGGGV
jgi:hypothetical protein